MTHVQHIHHCALLLVAEKRLGDEVKHIHPEHVHCWICSALKPATVVGVAPAINGKQAVSSTSTPPPALPAQPFSVPIITQQQVIMLLARSRPITLT